MELARHVGQNLLRIDALRHAHRDDRVETVLGRNEQREPHRREPRLQRQGAHAVAGVARLEPFVADEAQRLVERQDSRHGRRVVVRVGAPEALRSHRVEAPVHGGHRALLDHGPRAVREGDERHPGDRRETLLASGHDGIEPPVVHLQRHRAQGDDGVDDGEGAVLAREAGDLRQIGVEHPARGLALDEGDDVVARRRQRLAHHLSRDRAPRLRLEDRHVGAHARRHLAEPPAEGPGLQAKALAARPEQVGDRHLHRGRRGAGDAHDLGRLRLEGIARHVLEVLDDALHRRAEVIDHDAVGSRHRVRDRHRPRAHQEQGARAGGWRREARGAAETTRPGR